MLISFVRTAPTLRKAWHTVPPALAGGRYGGHARPYLLYTTHAVAEPLPRRPPVAKRDRGVRPTPFAAKSVHIFYMNAQWALV